MECRIGGVCKKGMVVLLVVDIVRSALFGFVKKNFKKELGFAGFSRARILESSLSKMCLAAWSRKGAKLGVGSVRSWWMWKVYVKWERKGWLDRTI